MASRALIFFAFIFTVGIIALLTSPIKLPKFDMALDSQNWNDDQSRSELSDRDSAAEEVRAVAAKITNIEQMITEGQDYAHTQRQLMRDEFHSLIDRMNGASPQIPDPDFIQRLEETMIGLTARVESLDKRLNEQQSVATTNQPRASAFNWHHSADVDSYPFVQDALPELGREFSPTSLLAQQPEISGGSQELRNTSPHYTIPPTTTLLNATALTALVGRIPIQGRLEDPWRFKIITGTENLAANGHVIPQISGMLWSGTARGDFALSCVSGNLDTAAYIFSDGTIRTARTTTQTDDLHSGLGWISDEQGNPCIGGELKTNALQFLAQSTLIDSTTAAARGYADSQVSSTTSVATGETSTSLTGEVDDFIAGRATAEALSEISQWLDARQQNSFDAVYVPAGQSVAIHIETPILIDYESDGRKVDHFGYAPANTGRHLGWLD